MMSGLDKISLLGHIREYMGGRSKANDDSQHVNGMKAMAEMFTPELKAELMKMFAGSLFGLEDHLVKNLQMGLDSIVVSA
jgi:hypothetical protein